MLVVGMLPPLSGGVAATGSLGGGELWSADSTPGLGLLPTLWRAGGGVYEVSSLDSSPRDNEAGFRDGSPITFAHQLEGNLLIVHGTGDDNVHYQSFEALVNELIKHNKFFTMMSYPNRSHGIREGENTSLHLFSLLTRYLTENVPAGPAR